MEQWRTVAQATKGGDLRKIKLRLGKCISAEREELTTAGCLPSLHSSSSHCFRIRCEFISLISFAWLFLIAWGKCHRVELIMNAMYSIYALVYILNNQVRHGVATKLEYTQRLHKRRSCIICFILFYCFFFWITLFLRSWNIYKSWGIIVITVVVVVVICYQQQSNSGKN